MEKAAMTSKTSSLKALLIRAWRERWTDLQWGINIKTILPRGVSGDVHNLADCILQQALVGSFPNELFLSYLTHSLCSQVISYAAVLQRISKYDCFDRPHCVLRLLRYVETMSKFITCRGRAEEELLPEACLSIVHWILRCYHHWINARCPQEHADFTPQSAEIAAEAAALLNGLVGSEFIRALLYCAKYENKDLHSAILKLVPVIKQDQQKSAVKIATSIDASLRQLHLRSVREISSTPRKEPEPITNCVQPLMAVLITVNPSTPTSSLVACLQMIQKMKNYSKPRLCAEVIRASVLCWCDYASMGMDSLWGSFAVYKLPNIVKDLTLSGKGGAVKPDPSLEVVEAFNLLQRYRPLLDRFDLVCGGNGLEFLAIELEKVNLLSRGQVREIAANHWRQMPPPPSDLSAQSLRSSLRARIVRAGPTLIGVLKSLDAESPKYQDAMLSVLWQVLAGETFELILAVATVQGKLKEFVARLIKSNECGRKMSNAPGKFGQTNALLFEISFLMLCWIVQNYGLSVIEGNGSSFFEQWAYHCLPLDDHPKSPNSMLKSVDPAKVNLLLRDVLQAQESWRPNRWHLFCETAAGVVKELLHEWDWNALAAADVKRGLNNLRLLSCCLPVCASAWLCAHMNVCDQEAVLKPMNMLLQFLNTAVPDDTRDNYRERTNLMYKVIRNMQSQLNLRPQMKLRSNGIISKDPLQEKLQEIWKFTFDNRWIQIQKTQELASLLKSGGSSWMVANLIEELFKLNYEEELDRAVDLMFSIFHLDIEDCTVQLIGQVLKQYLRNQAKVTQLVEPQSEALAKLCAYCILSSVEDQRSANKVNRKRKRTESEPGKVEIDFPANKIAKTEESRSFKCAVPATPPKRQSSFELREPLLGALRELFSTFDQFADGNAGVSQRTRFAVYFLNSLAQCSKDKALVVFQVMPPSLVTSLLKTTSELFSMSSLFRFYDVRTVPGRKAIARDLTLLHNIQLKQGKR